MNYFLLFFPAIMLFSCSDHTNSQKEETKHHPPTEKKILKEEKKIIPSTIDYTILDSAVRDHVKKLDSLYGRTPYYFKDQNKMRFIVMRGQFHEDSVYYASTLFSGLFKYGIAGEQSKLVLQADYDKIYNPNITVLNCVELKKAGKIGLYNFTTNEILEPQFDYILPSTAPANKTAFGFKNGSWYKIENEAQKFKVAASNFSPLNFFKTLSFDIAALKKEELFYDAYSTNESEPYANNGSIVVFTPSYLEYLKVIPQICEDFIEKNEKQHEFGTDQLRLQTDTTRSITDKLVSFIVSFYKTGVDARGYVEENNNVITYNTSNKTFHKNELNHKYDGYDNFCRPEGYRFINDSTIEILQRSVDDSTKKSRYDFENTYTYKRILKNGEVIDLKTNRYYEFTKYVQIDDNYFKGCYATWIEGAFQEDDGNVWVSEHLTIDDLDLMINEIYADYGFKFKSAKWQTYFSKFKWYKPQFDNIDSKLNAIDKKNIETIAKEKEKMKGKEAEIVKRHKERYEAAG